MTHPSEIPIGSRPGRTPVWAAFTLTWINNIGASAALMGIYFIAHSSYGYTNRDNLYLALVQGATYIVGALTAGPVGRMIAGPGRAMSTRSLVGLVMAAMALVCWLPLVWRSPAALWVQMAVYSPLSGWLWPLIESFLASGRSGADLRRTTGAFNFSWSSCQFITFWALPVFMPTSLVVSPEAAAKAAWAMPVLALSHVLAMAVLARIPPEPGTHADSADETLTPVDRDNYKRLLKATRCLVVLSYAGYMATSPLLPGRLADDFKITPQWQTPITSIWMISRVAMFFFMSRWHGWHGKRRTLVWSALLLVLGTNGILMAPTPEALALALVLFGIGHGAIYSSAFYYAMEVGSAGVDAGGWHEAIIGVGYLLGPIAALLATLFGREFLPAFKITVIIDIMAVGAGMLALFAASRRTIVRA